LTNRGKRGNFSPCEVVHKKGINFPLAGKGVIENLGGGTCVYCEKRGTSYTLDGSDVCRETTLQKGKKELSKEGRQEGKAPPGEWSILFQGNTLRRRCLGLGQGQKPGKGVASAPKKHYAEVTFVELLIAKKGERP